MSALRDLLYPKRCPMCLRALPPGRTLVCPECARKAAVITGPACFRCGRPLASETREYCAHCEKHKPAYEEGLSWALYSSPRVRRFLYRVKYYDERQLLDWPCLDFAARRRERILSWEAEAIVPVPVHPARLRTRGYNQAEEIALRLGRALGIPVDGQYLTRTEKTSMQKELGAADRALNLSGAFRASAPHKKYRRVILADDILTTGATAEACARAILLSGAEKVFLLTLATGRDD